MVNEATILLVDDNDDDVLLMKRAMRKAGIINPVQVLTHGTQVVDYLERRPPYSDVRQYPFPMLILLDLKMPRMSGFELLEWIRKQPKLKRLWVIILTHSPESSDIVRAYDLGANSYLVKPSTFSALVELSTFLKQYWLNLAQKPDCQLE
jgi:CheY-like chemotaxis protein